MKKFVALSTIMLCLLGLQAQPSISNSNFEQWSDGSPVNWTVDIQGTLVGSMTIPVEVHFGGQSSVSHSGYSAVRITSADVTSTAISYTMNLPGILQAGEPNDFTVPMNDALDVFNTLQDSAGIANILSNLDSLNLDDYTTFFKMLSKGVPCDSTPKSVTAWVKYIPQVDDQMAMFSMTKQNGALVDYTFQLFDSGDPDSYQQIGVDFNTPGAPCDSILVILISATQMQSSSVLYIDDVRLSFRGDDIESYDNFPGKVYPNPATDQFCIHPYNEFPYEWTLTDMTGKTLLSGEATGETSIDTRNCAPGLYLLRLSGDGMSGARKVIIR